MKYQTITYQRVVNLGSYESKRLEMTMELNEQDDVAQCCRELINQVESTLGIETKTPKPTNYDDKPY